MIDRRYPPDQIVETHRFVEMGQKIGIVVISVWRGLSNPRSVSEPVKRADAFANRPAWATRSKEAGPGPASFAPSVPLREGW